VITGFRHKALVKALT